MSYSPPRKRRYDRSPSPAPRYRSRSRSGSPSRRRDDDVQPYNPGNNLYVTGLSVRVNERDLEDYFSKEGKAKRKRPRTPTPGTYLGFRNTRTVSSYDRDRRRGHSDSRRSPRYSPYRNGRDYSPQYSPYRRRYRDRSPSPPRYSPYRSPPRGGGSYRARQRSRSRSVSPYGYR